MRRWWVALLPAILLMSQSFAQEYAATSYWRPFVSVGYWYAPSDLNDYYSIILDYYRERGVPIPLQSKFGRTFCIDAGVVYSRIQPIEIGLSAGFRYAPAYSGYEDFAGVLKIDGSIATYAISFVMHDNLMSVWGRPLILTVEPGITYTNVSITDDLHFKNLSQFDEKLQWAGSTWGFQFRFLLGTAVPVGPFVASLHAGYQKGVARVTEPATTDTGRMITGRRAASLDQEGPMILFKLGFNL